MLEEKIYVKYNDLVSYGKFLDSVFKERVKLFMLRHMPSFPLGLLSTEENRWSVKPALRYKVKSQKVDAKICRICSTAYPISEDEITFCINCETLTALATCHSESRPFILGKAKAIVIVDTELVDKLVKGEYTFFQDGVPISGWSTGDSDEAYAIAIEMNEENQSSRCGFPWALSTCYQPSNRINLAQLGEAGFTIAYYTGGDDDSYRLCVIDGGGYDILTAHFAKLYFIVYRDIGWGFQTEKGERYFEEEECK